MVVCKICNKEYKVLTINHLKTHNITKQEYLKDIDPQAKFSWNNGLTKNNDVRVLNYGENNKRKIKFSKEEEEDIVKRYKSGETILSISKDFQCSVHPIIDFLNKGNIRRTCSEAMSLIMNTKRIPIVESYYSHNGKNLFVKKGTIYDNRLIGNSILKLKCVICDKEFERTLHCYTLSLKSQLGKILCLPCAVHTKSNPKISSQQREIHKLIGGELNYLISNIFVDIALIDKNIIIEYDGWYWHKNRLNGDRRRDEFLKSLGWKILRIKGGRKIPDINLINDKIASLVNTDRTYTEIIMEGWG